MPDRPEHHYRYDPAKSEAYLATTLAWIGDPAAERYARHVLARIESAVDGPPRPRRAASARLDLSLALIAAGRHDEAAGTTLEAISSGRLVPSVTRQAWRSSRPWPSAACPRPPSWPRRTGKPAATATVRRCPDTNPALPAVELVQDSQHLVQVLRSPVRSLRANREL